MKLWTVQMSQWRVARDREIPFLDTTVKSGDRVFAPSWDIVTKVKAHEITPEQYTEQYTRMMRNSYVQNHARWMEVCQMERVAISCYCPEGVFCHRHVLADMFAQVCRKHKIEFKLEGELTRR